MTMLKSEWSISLPANVSGYRDIGGMPAMQTWHYHEYMMLLWLWRHHVDFQKKDF